MIAVDLQDGLGDDHPFAAAEVLFRKMASERLDILSRSWARLQNGQNMKEALADIRHVAHVIAGTAPSFGFADLGGQADRLEQVAAESANPEAVLIMLRPFIANLADLAED